MARPPALDPIVDDPAQGALVSDYDGTLAPIVDDPARARPIPRALRALAELTGPLALVAVVSGRPVEFLREHVPIDGVTLVGQYGLERLVDGEILVDDRVGAFIPAVAAAVDDAARRWPRLQVERKGTSAFTVHWRRAPEAAPEPEALRALADTYGLMVHPGRRAAEVRVPLPIDKGTALRCLVDEQPLRACAFAGDDTGDLSAFAMLAEHAAARPDFAGIRIAVRSPEAPTGLLETADHVVDGPQGLATLLEELAVTLRRRG